MTQSIFLVIPGVALPGPLLHDLSYDLPLPGLRELLATGRLHDQSHVQNKLPSLLTASVQPGRITAAAALRRIGLGYAADEAHWLCIDPVHLGFRERSLVVHDPVLMSLSVAEAQELAVSLAPTLAAFGELSVDDPLRWHLRLRQAAPEFVPLDSAISARATLGLCQDKAWQVALNEAQMILHQHPVNLRRAALGLLPINSFWPWGGGQLPACSGPVADRSTDPSTVLFSNNPCLRGLALHYGQPTEPLPNAFAALSNTETKAEIQLVAIDTLEAPARSGDAQPWRNALLDLEEHWFAPLLSAWQQRQSRNLTFHFVFPGHDMAHHLDMPPARLSPALRRALHEARRKLGFPFTGNELNDLAQPLRPHSR